MKLQKGIVRRGGRKLTLAACCAAYLAALSAIGSAQAAEGTLARMCEGVSRYWQTAFTNEVRVPWVVCPSAVSATLKVTGMDGETVTSITRSGGELETAHFLAVPTGEDVYALELTYRDAGGAALETVTGTVAFVKGVASDAVVEGVAVDVSEVKPWNRTVRPGTDGGRVVLGYEAGWIGDETAAHVHITKQGSAGVASDGPVSDGGWVAWNLRRDWGYGWFDVSLVGEDADSLLASVWRPNDCFIIIFK